MTWLEAGSNWTGSYPDKLFFLHPLVLQCVKQHGEFLDIVVAAVTRNPLVSEHLELSELIPNYLDL